MPDTIFLDTGQEKMITRYQVINRYQITTRYSWLPNNYLLETQILNIAPVPSPPPPPPRLCYNKILHLNINPLILCVRDKRYKRGEGLYSNEDLNIRHPRHGGGGGAGDRVNWSSGISLEIILVPGLALFCINICQPDRCWF